MLGDNDSDLGIANQGAQVINQQKEFQQQEGDKQVDKAQEPYQVGADAKAAGQAQVGTAAGMKKLNQIRITPQMAKGLKEMTGQSWDQTVGTEWDPNVFTALTTGMAQAKYRQDLLSNREQLEQLREQSRQSIEGEKEGAAQTRVETQQAGANARNKQKVAATRERTAATATKSSTKDLQADKTLLHEAEKRRTTLSSMFADDPSKQEAQKWLTDNADALQQAVEKIKQMGSISTKPAQQGGAPPQESSGTDKTIPLNNQLPGLE